MIVCTHCTKVIKGKAVCTNPPIIAIQLGLDQPKTFHPSCYAKSERDKAQRLADHTL